MRVAAVSLAVLALAGSSAQALRLPAAPRCPIFPATSAWNQRVDTLPVAPDSARLVASIGLDAGLHADFGSGLWNGGPIGIPFDVVTRKTPRSHVSFQYADESNRVRYPIPRTVHVEGGRGSTGDRHALLLDGMHASCTSSTPSTRSRAAAGAPARERSGTCARTPCGLRAGRRRTRPGCRSSPASPATTRSREA